MGVSDSGADINGCILVMYFRREKGICTIDQAKKKRREIINTTLLVLIVGVLGYVIWLYGVVEIIGVWLGLWDFY